MATGLIVNVGADTTDFKTEIRELPKEFEKAEQEITQSADRVGGAIDGALKGLLSAGTVVALERVINHFDKVADAASKYGETAEDIQRVGTAAELTGGNIDSIAMAMERAGVAAAKAARGNEEFIEKFNRAGIDAAAFSAATLTERVEMVAAAQQAAGTSGDRHAAILEALGDSVAGIDFQRIADEMGNVIVASNETVEQLSRANDIMHQAKGTAMVFAAEGLGLVADYFERIGSILGEASGQGVLGRLGAWIKLSMQTTPAAGLANMLGLGGKTIKEMEEAERRLNAIALLRSRDGIDNATEEQIKAEMDAIVERERAATSATNETNSAIDAGKAKTQETAKIKQRLLEVSLWLKEAEAAGNAVLVQKLKYNEDILKGILKYKDAEDAYAMAVREANAELAKRRQKEGGKNADGSPIAPFSAEDTVSITAGKLDQINAIYEANRALIAANPELTAQGREAQIRELDEQYRMAMRNNAMMPDISDRMYYDKTEIEVLRNMVRRLNSGKDQWGDELVSYQLREMQRMMQEAAMLPTSQQPTSGPNGNSPESPDQANSASESTLQKAVALLEQLNTKLPQPVLV